MYELVDILTQIKAIKEDSSYSTLLSYFDSSSGIVLIVSKLQLLLPMLASSYFDQNSKRTNQEKTDVQKKVCCDMRNKV